MAEDRAWLQKLAEKTQEAGDDTGFWDNVVGAIVNRVLGSAQVMERLGIAGPEAPSREEIDKAVKTARPTEGWGGVLGDIVATAPLMAMPGGPVAGGVAAGAITGLTEPVRGDADFLEEKATQVGIGAGLGGVAGTFGRLLGAAAKRAPESLNREALKLALPPGSKEKVTELGHKGISQLKTAWDAAWKEVTPGLRINVDQQLTNDLASVRNRMMAEGFTDEQIKRFWNVVEGQIIEPATRGATGGVGVIAGDAAQRVQSQLRKLAVSREDIEHPLMAAREIVLDAIERGSPAVADQFKALRSNYTKFLAVEKATAAASTTDAAGLFTPQQLGAAARGLDTTAQRGATAAGQGPMAELVSEGIEQRVGKPSAVTEVLAPTWFGGVARMAERSPTVRAVGAGVEQATVPTTTTATTPLVRGAVATPSLGEYRYEPVAPDFDADQILSPYLDDGIGGDSEFDDIIKRFEGESSIDRIHGAIIGQESGGVHARKGRITTSPQGALGLGQIMPATFKQYARPGERIDNEQDNFNVSRRIIASHYQKYGGDARKVAAAYFSGRPDYTSTKTDATGKTVAGYVSDVMRRMKEA